jgi:hypothetical protein
MSESVHLDWVLFTFISLIFDFYYLCALFPQVTIRFPSLACVPLPSLRMCTIPSGFAVCYLAFLPQLAYSPSSPPRSFKVPPSHFLFSFLVVCSSQPLVRNLFGSKCIYLMMTARYNQTGKP